MSTVREFIENGLIIHEKERIAPAVILATLIVISLFAIGFLYQLVTILGG